ncbi:M15 family metallopeptidase [Demequina lutea]|uniref:D-alanyl-D-alanine dipeptidase n=1 Tax=Demequina lutea TaxID=431489 RepID=A0A7Y9ZBZ4_9MICO|nr:M15 family metallopeptidase [Demequina lutea]NYI42567.1 D-alanyl-D-alanine dipeptidase [Demequina lutea]
MQQLVAVTPHRDALALVVLQTPRILRMVERSVCDDAVKLKHHVGRERMLGQLPNALHRRYFDEYLDELRALHPGLGATELASLASRYVSPPEIAPHSSGAAVYLTLCDSAGKELDMGTRVNASPEESDGRCYTDVDGLSPEARANRDILASALTAVGLVNYPTEWWHWTYGDRYWALAAGAPHALYGPVDQPRPS